MLKGFRDFILRGNVIDLAVAVVIGAAFNNIVTALVKDLITPLIGILGKTPDFSNLVISVNGSPECLSQIPTKAIRCKYCTALLKK